MTKAKRRRVRKSDDDDDVDPREVLVTVRGGEKVSLYHLFHAAMDIMRERFGREPTADDCMEWLLYDQHDDATVERWRRVALDMQRAH
jgi:hypothetical protein